MKYFPTRMKHRRIFEWCRILRVDASQSVLHLMLVLYGSTNVSLLEACPFCGVVGQPLAEVRDHVDVTAVGDSILPPVDNLQRLLVLQVLRGKFSSPTGDVVARVRSPIHGTALLFGTQARADFPAELDWQAMPADEGLLAYVALAPDTSLPAVERLRWFSSRLEHFDQVIADDAFAEFGQAPFEAVLEAFDSFDPIKLQQWVGEVGVRQSRRGFYGLALGCVAHKTTDINLKEACLETLRTEIRKPADDFRAGFDGLLAGLLVGEGEKGLQEFVELGLFNKRTRATDQRHLLSALRFGHEYLGAWIAQDQIAEATARLIHAPAVSADTVVDLARMQYWKSIDEVALLWQSLGSDDVMIRRAVAGYLSACPLPAASEHLEAIRKIDSVKLQQAIAAAALPRAS